MTRKKSPTTPPEPEVTVPEVDVAPEVSSWSVETLVAAQPVPTKPAWGRKVDGEPAAPTIGRIVHYGAREGTLPAIVTRVSETEQAVDLVVFSAEGAAPKANVPFADAAGPRVASWPPR